MSTSQSWRDFLQGLATGQLEAFGPIQRQWATWLRAQSENIDLPPGVTEGIKRVIGSQVGDLLGGVGRPNADLEARLAKLEAEVAAMKAGREKPPED